MPTARDPIGVQRRFVILQRDNFTCLFCGARPGNDRLHVDHLIPHSKQGSDHDNNLGTACDRCNNGKSNRIAIPLSLCTSEKDADGWIIWKRWEEWVLVWNPEPAEPPFDDFSLVDHSCAAALVHQPTRYWFDLNRVWEPDWHKHISWKSWMRDDDDIAQIKNHRASQTTKPGLISAVEWLSRKPHPLELRPAAGRRWLAFCEAMDFARTLIRRPRFTSQPRAHDDA